MDGRSIMDHTLLRVGLPVKCAYGDCESTGFVKPHSDYGGWYKSRLFRFNPRKRWFCPEHSEFGQAKDNQFYENYRTPDPEPQPEDIETELYKLLDD